MDKARRWIGWGLVAMGTSVLLRALGSGRRRISGGYLGPPPAPPGRTRPPVGAAAEPAPPLPGRSAADAERRAAAANGAANSGDAGGERAETEQEQAHGTGPVALLRRTFAEWSEDKVPTLAASLAYYTIFSLAPLLIIVIAVLGLFGQSNAQSTVVAQFQQAVGEQAAELVATMIENRASEGGNVLATVIAGLILLVGATGVFVQLQNALNTIWGVEPDPERSGLGRLLRVRAMSLGMILAIGFLLLVSLVLTTVIESFAGGAGGALPGGAALWAVLNWLLSLAVITLLFAMIFKFLPDAVISWRTVWIGAIVTALLFTVGKWGLGLYLSRAAVASSYGAAGSLVALLLWVFYSAQIVLFGGEFTQVYARRRGSGIRPADHAVRAGD